MSEHRITENEELALRGRVTALEEWAAAVTSTLQTLGIGLAAALIAGVTLSLILRKRLR